MSGLSHASELMTVLRPPQHVTNDRGEALLRTILAPLGWTAIRIGMGEDYGRDYEVEIFHKGKSTGMLLNLQLKSSVAPAYSRDKEFVSVRLKTRNACYLANELRHPTFVLQADLSQNRLFWSAPQIDEALRATLAKKPIAGSCTVRVLVRNELPATVDDLPPKTSHRARER